jgi:hypothetical protein
MTDNIPIITEYNGKPVIILNPGEYQFRFGIRKAKLFMSELHQIREHIRYYKALYQKKKSASGGKQILKAKLSLDMNNKYPVELSIYKCELITEPENLEAIKSFINKNA